MALFHAFRMSAARRALRREAAPDRPRRGVNLADAQKIGLLYTDTDEAGYKRIKTLQRHLTSEYGTRTVNALCYVPQKEKQLPVWHTQTPERAYFTKDDLSWCFKPSGEAQTFEQTPFDVLIDLTDGTHVPLQFVVARSVAGMKVGRASAPRANDYDLTLEVGSGASIQVFMQEVERYLTQMTFV